MPLSLALIHPVDLIHTDMIKGRPVAVMLGPNMISVGTAETGIYAHVVPTEILSQWTEQQAHDNRIYGADDFARDGLMIALEHLLLALGFDPEKDHTFRVDIQQLTARIKVHQAAQDLA